MPLGARFQWGGRSVLPRTAVTKVHVLRPTRGVRRTFSRIVLLLLPFKKSEKTYTVYEELMWYRHEKDGKVCMKKKYELKYTVLEKEEQKEICIEIMKFYHS